MSSYATRFECVLEPGETWMVWDTKREAPAEYSGIALVGLTQGVATQFRDLLNLASGKRTAANDASAIRRLSRKR